MGRLEQGASKPSLGTVVTLCKALGVGCDEFLKPPQAHDKAGPGRPAKAKPEAVEAKPKKARDRPKKGQ